MNKRTQLSLLSSIVMYLHYVMVCKVSPGVCLSRSWRCASLQSLADKNVYPVYWLVFRSGQEAVMTDI